MTTVGPIVRRAPRVTHTVVLAGVRWPVYKLEALALGLVLALILGLILGSAQIAILAGAALATVRWVAGAAARRSAG
ncbi:hypothetical protein [Nocardia spumae]|uniref:hypothetical protein n=1 Tax=Nocardia spumae TaxID=2887190 RepID=UPI001D1393A8|nr:hypothetical protein [Nocardia spumae]